MKLVITGGGGFIGSHLADRLLEEDHQVLIVDNFATGSPSNIPQHPAASLIEADIGDEQAVHDVIASWGPDVVVHAAASYSDPDAWQLDLQTNAVGTANVVRATEAARCERLIYFQTSLCYGKQPIEEPVTLEHPLRPDSSYAISKTAGEQYIALSGLNYVSFRLANPIGPRTLSGPLPAFVQRLTNGQPVFVADTRRDFIYISDLIDLVMLAIGGRGHGSYHASSGTDVSIKELLVMALNALGMELEEEVEVRPRADDDTYSILIDPSRTEQEFNWRTTTPIEEGVRRAVEWYRTNEIGDTYTHLKIGK